MRYFIQGVLIVVFMGSVVMGPEARAAADSPEILDSARHEALSHIAKGERLPAANGLLKTLRAIPSDRADLAPPAVGVVQVLLFNTEYLMHKGEREKFFTESLDETRHPIDLLLATLMRYADDAGISVEEAERCVRDLHRLSRGDNQLVRLGALFTMSSPYFLYDTGWAQTARDRIVSEFPDNELSVEAQRLVLYRAEQFGPDGLNVLFNALDQKGELRKHSQRLRKDPIGAAVYSNLEARRGAKDDTTLAETLVAAATNSTNWAEEYAALSIIADLDLNSAGARMMEAASEAIVRNSDPRCVFRARTLRLILARSDGDLDMLVEDTNSLLDIGDLPLVPERNNYEELMNHVRQSADRIAELGHMAFANDLRRRLADRFPGSALAAELELEMGPAAEENAGTATN